MRGQDFDVKSFTNILSAFHILKNNFTPLWTEPSTSLKNEQALTIANHFKSNITLLTHNNGIDNNIAYAAMLVFAGDLLIKVKELALRQNLHDNETPGTALIAQSTAYFSQRTCCK